MERTSGASRPVFRPKFAGRMEGVGYLVLSVSEFDLFYVLPRLHVRADGATTATNIGAHEGPFPAGLAAALIGGASYLDATALPPPPARTGEPDAVSLRSIVQPTGIVIEVVALIFQPIPLPVRADRPYLHAITLDQRQALEPVLLFSYGQAYDRRDRALGLSLVLKRLDPECGPAWPRRLTCPL